MIMLLKRFYRRVKWLLFYQWYSLTLNSWSYESCKICGKSFRIRWNVKDTYWKKVVNVSDSGGGSLCVDCFLELAEKKLIQIKSSDIEIEIFDPHNL